jgi:alpha-beta hydrolase superfamily lysophospholipase
MGKEGGSFWTRGPGILLLSVLILAGSVTSASLALIYDVTHPPPTTGQLDPADVIIEVEEISFEAQDGVALEGWFVRGRSRWPVIIICHQLGASRSDLLNTAVSLSQKGYPLLMFDFRGHGASAGRGSTLGIEERLDVLGAVEYLDSRDDIDASRYGAWGIGLGAYAAALAALEREEIVVLALDSPYPDVRSQLDRLVGERLPKIVQPLVPIVRLFYNPYMAFRMDRYRLSDSIAALANRNLLLIAATEDPAMLAEQQMLHDALPESAEGNANLIQMKATVVTGLYGKDRQEYDEAIVEFFSKHLGRERKGRSSEVEIIEMGER